MNILDIKKYDVVNGPGMRCSIWIAGCKNHCKECWSPQTWNPDQGKSYVSCINSIKETVNNPMVDGISILGGDPFYWLFNGNAVDKFELKELLSICNDINKPIWLWTGYKYEDILEYYPDYLSYIDVLIDGKFKHDLKDLSLFWRGSSNQRVIDVQKSLKENKVILWNLKK